MKLYYVDFVLKTSGMFWKIEEYDYEVKNKIIKYVVKKDDDIKTKTIHQTTIMKLRNKFIPNTSYIRNSIFCFEEQLEEAKKILQKNVIDQAFKFRNEIAILYDHMLFNLKDSK